MILRECKTKATITTFKSLLHGFYELKCQDACASPPITYTLFGFRHHDTAFTWIDPRHVFKTTKLLWTTKTGTLKNLCSRMYTVQPSRRKAWALVTKGTDQVGQVTVMDVHVSALVSWTNRASHRLGWVAGERAPNGCRRSTRHRSFTSEPQLEHVDRSWRARWGGATGRSARFSSRSQR